MKNRASRLDARVDKVAAGFTIIETILFIAIAGLVFTGVIAGTNGAIRRQRYKDAVNSFVDDMRELYSLVENTEVLSNNGDGIQCAYSPIEDAWKSGSSSNTGRGRSDCSVYGIIAKISMTSSDTRDNIQAYWLIGNDQRKVETEVEYDEDSDFDDRFLSTALASPWVRYSDGRVEKIEAFKSSLFWGAELAATCDSLPNDLVASPLRGNYTECQGTDPIGVVEPRGDLSFYLLIFRSPINNSIRTRVAYTRSDGSSNGYLEKNSKLEYVSEDPTNIQDRSFRSGQKIEFCVTSGKGMSYSGGYRMISIKENAASSLDVRLVEADSPENTCNK